MMVNLYLCQTEATSTNISLLLSRHYRVGILIEHSTTVMNPAQKYLRLILLSVHLLSFLYFPVVQRLMSAKSRYKKQLPEGLCKTTGLFQRLFKRNANCQPEGEGQLIFWK